MKHHVVASIYVIYNMKSHISVHKYRNRIFLKVKNSTNLCKTSNNYIFYNRYLKEHILSASHGLLKVPAKF